MAEWPALRGYLAEVLGSADAVAVTPIAGGQSNPTYRLDVDGRGLILRKQPDGPILKGAHAVDREYRVLRALDGTAAPVPTPVAYCADRTVVGTSFYLMGFVEGRIFTDATLAEVPKARRRGIWLAAADALAAVHGIDVAARGLGDFGRPGGYFARQVARWSGQLAAAATAPGPALTALAAWLPANMPPDDGAVALTHGDFRLGNLIFHPQEDRVVAILDWELSTLGHPLADLAFCCMPWHSAPGEYGGLLGHDLAALGLPTEAEVVAHYRASAPKVGALTPAHLAFALFRFAVIFIGIADRAKAGTAAGQNAEALAPLAERFAIRAMEIVEGRNHRID